MTRQEIEQQILRIADELSLTDKAMAKLMKINYFNYARKKGKTITSAASFFNEKNYKTVASSLIEYGERLKERLKDQGLELEK
ncbi:MAG: hypothetical protein LBQ84_08335 [Flavobacteriaceae bacterium]|jgi:hypothetical protein|nr:hypothetical protein [Flavobacteriaceae bacterium]